MDEQSEDGFAADRSKRLRRGLVVGGALAVLGIGTLVTLNLAAGRAGGADADAEGTEQVAEEAAAETGSAVPVEVAQVASGSISAFLTASANLVAEDEVVVLSEIEGRVSRVTVEEGDRVRRGQTLAQLVKDDEEIALRKAELREVNSRMVFERGRDLAGQELISREDLDRLTMDSELARQELAEARWRLDRTSLSSPFDGRVTERSVRVGQHIRPGDQLFRITDFEPLIARIYLPERDVLELDEGRAVEIRLAADERVGFAGRIRQISPVVDTATGTVKVTVEAESPPPGVRPGSFVTIAIVRESRDGVLLVPREAVLRELRSAHVFVAGEGKALKREVELGLEQGKLVEVTGGLEAGERVIVAGQGALKEGSEIKVLDSAVAEG